jgi:hypothetical protein
MKRVVINRALLLAIILILSSISSVLAGPVVQNPSFVFPSVPYSFSTATNTFSGEASGGQLVTAADSDVSATLNVTFTDLGDFVGGTFSVTGGIPSLGIPAASLLMQGEVTGIATIFDTPDVGFVPVFDLVVNTVNPLLGFDADIGQWSAAVCNPTFECSLFSGGPTSLEDLFTTDYTDSHLPLNSFIRTSQVPYPAAGLLLGLGVALLAVRRRSRHASPRAEQPA